MRQENMYSPSDETGPSEEMLASSNASTPHPQPSFVEAMQFLAGCRLPPTTSEAQRKPLLPLQLLRQIIISSSGSNIPPPATASAPRRLRIEKVSGREFDPYDGCSWDKINVVEEKGHRSYMYKCSHEPNCPVSKAVFVTYHGDHSHKRGHHEAEGGDREAANDGNCGLKRSRK
ncbi:hypothetical protein TIFTF001_011226 [Ficus carica]|uniref:WRKY domain-containing protein n=1 Tax=Ficus carica TaxID=3494 RepID=A0AA88D564_FICCA|nr:hypothetical protein TIFTF001_011226 [Ficus carica]